MTCIHDPMFTFDGRCLKCHPPKRILAVQHIDGMVEVDDTPRPGYIVNQAAQMWGWMGDNTITTGEIAELEARCDETDGNREER